jgi:hypothetical protein
MVKINNIEVDVDITSIVTNDTLDESLASGSIVIPFSSQSVPYERFSEVNIDDLLFVVSEDSVTQIRKGATPLYKHEISLIEPTKILQKRVIPNITVTQPQGEVGEYAFSVHNTTNTIVVNNTQQTLSLTQTSPSRDLTQVDGLTLKKQNEPYEIYVNMRIENRQVNFERLNFEVELLIGGVVRTTKVYNIRGRFSTINKIELLITGFPFFYTPATVNQNVSIRVRTVPEPFGVNDVAHLTEFSITIAKALEVDNKIYLDDVVDKLLSFHPTFTLAEATRVKLAQTVSPEFTFQNYTLYDALKEVANYVSGIVYLGEDDFTTIYFYYYDQVLDQVLDFTDQSNIEYLAEFTDGFEINAPNVIREENERYAIIEPSATGFISIRSNNEERAVAIIDTQSAIRLQHPIYRLIKVEVKGLAFEMIDPQNNNAVVNRPNTEIYDITPYIIENTRYNTFDSAGSPNSRGTFKNKSNTVIYTQGSDLITNLGFTGSLPPAWNQTYPLNYAIHEAILNAAQLKYQSLSFSQDYRVTASLHDLQFRFKYIPYSDVRLTVFKRKGENIMYFNEQAPLNDMELLGRVAQESVERSGNRLHRYEGLTPDDRLLLGSKKDDEVLVNYTISRTPKINKFVAEYAVGYANISNYVGVKSAFRQYEVPTTTIVNRRDKVTKFYELKIYNTVQTNYELVLTSTMYRSLWGNFFNNPIGERPTYAKLEFDDGPSTPTLFIESTVDAYRMGKTIGLAVDMFDNYSAGIKKVEKEFGTSTNKITNKVQEDARYTNDLGRIKNVKIQFKQNPNANNPDNYPNNNDVSTQVMLEHAYEVNKDARERYGFVYELAFFGGNIILFDGFVKYNRLASELTPNKIEFRLLESGYIPQRSFDINRTKLVTGVFTTPSSFAYGIIQTTVPNGTDSYSGLVLTINQEPILAIISNDYISGVTVTKYLYLEEL